MAPIREGLIPFIIIYLNCQYWALIHGPEQWRQASNPSLGPLVEVRKRVALVQVFSYKEDLLHSCKTHAIQARNPNSETLIQYTPVNVSVNKEPSGVLSSSLQHSPGPPLLSFQVIKHPKRGGEGLFLWNQALTHKLNPQVRTLFLQ